METVTCALSLSLVVPGDARLPVEAHATYAAGDPYAVRLDIATGEECSVTWHIGRDLLATGLSQPAGDGDVRVKPVVTEQGRRAVRLTLRSPEGTAALEAPLAQVAEFLTETYVLVPTGCESEHLGLDAGLARLLAG